MKHYSSYDYNSNIYLNIYFQILTNVYLNLKKCVSKLEKVCPNLKKCVQNFEKVCPKFVFFSVRTDNQPQNRAKKTLGLGTVLADAFTNLLPPFSIWGGCHPFDLNSTS